MYIQAPTYKYVHTLVYTHAHTNMHTYTYSSQYTHAHEYAHVRIEKQMHKYTNEDLLSRRFFQFPQKFKQRYMYLIFEINMSQYTNV